MGVFPTVRGDKQLLEHGRKFNLRMTRWHCRGLMHANLANKDLQVYEQHTFIAVTGVLTLTKPEIEW